MALNTEPPAGLVNPNILKLKPEPMLYLGNPDVKLPNGQSPKATKLFVTDEARALLEGHMFSGKTELNTISLFGSDFRIAHKITKGDQSATVILGTDIEGQTAAQAMLTSKDKVKASDVKGIRLVDDNGEIVDIPLESLSSSKPKKASESPVIEEAIAGTTEERRNARKELENVVQYGSAKPTEVTKHFYEEPIDGEESSVTIDRPKQKKTKKSPARTSTNAPSSNPPVAAEPTYATEQFQEEVTDPEEPPQPTTHNSPPNVNTAPATQINTAPNPNVLSNPNILSNPNTVPATAPAIISSPDQPPAVPITLNADTPIQVPTELAVVFGQDNIASQARDLAARQMQEGVMNNFGERMRHFGRRLFKHNWMKEYFQNQYENLSKKLIETTGTIMADQSIDQALAQAKTEMFGNGYWTGGRLGFMGRVIERIKSPLMGSERAVYKRANEILAEMKQNGTIREVELQKLAESQIVQRFEDVSGDLLHQTAGEKIKEMQQTDPQSITEIKDIIRKYAKGEAGFTTRDELVAHVQKLHADIRGRLEGKQFDTNDHIYNCDIVMSGLLETAELFKASIAIEAHNGGLTNVDDILNQKLNALHIKLGRAEIGARVHVEKSRVEKMLNYTAGKLGFAFVNEPVVGTAIASALCMINHYPGISLLTNLSLAARSVTPLLGGSLSAGIFGMFTEKARLGTERLHHMRQRETGMIFGNERSFFEQSMLAQKPASELQQRLQTTSGQITSVDSLQSAIQSFTETEARIAISDDKNIKDTLISYATQTGIDVERTALDVAKKDAKASIMAFVNNPQNASIVTQVTGGASIADFMTRLTTLQKTQYIDGSTQIATLVQNAGVTSQEKQILDQMTVTKGLKEKAKDFSGASWRRAAIRGGQVFVASFGGGLALNEIANLSNTVHMISSGDLPPKMTYLQWALNGFKNETNVGPLFQGTHQEVVGTHTYTLPNGVTVQDINNDGIRDSIVVEPGHGATPAILNRAFDTDGEMTRATKEWFQKEGFLYEGETINLLEAGMHGPIDIKEIAPGIHSRLNLPNGIDALDTDHDGILDHLKITQSGAQIDIKIQPNGEIAFTADSLKQFAAAGIDPQKVIDGMSTKIDSIKFGEHTVTHTDTHTGVTDIDQSKLNTEVIHRTYRDNGSPGTIEKLEFGQTIRYDAATDKIIVTQNVNMHDITASRLPGEHFDIKQALTDGKLRFQVSNLPDPLHAGHGNGFKVVQFPFTQSDASGLRAELRLDPHDSQVAEIFKIDAAGKVRSLAPFTEVVDVRSVAADGHINVGVISTEVWDTTNITDTHTHVENIMGNVPTQTLDFDAMQSTDTLTPPDHIVPFDFIEPMPTPILERDAMSKGTRPEQTTPTPPNPIAVPTPSYYSYNGNNSYYSSQRDLNRPIQVPQSEEDRIQQSIPSLLTAAYSEWNIDTAEQNRINNLSWAEQYKWLQNETNNRNNAQIQQSQNSTQSTNQPMPTLQQVAQQLHIPIPTQTIPNPTQVSSPDTTIDTTINNGGNPTDELINFMADQNASPIENGAKADAIIDMNTFLRSADVHTADENNFLSKNQAINLYKDMLIWAQGKSFINFYDDDSSYATNPIYPAIREAAISIIDETDPSFQQTINGLMHLFTIFDSTHSLSDPTNEDKTITNAFVLQAAFDRIKEIKYKTT